MTLYITDLSDPAIYPAKIRRAITDSEEDDCFNLITKDPQSLIDGVFARLSQAQLNQVILQVSITGLGSTPWEPNVKDPDKVFKDVENILDTYPQLPVTLRYDPIIPGINDGKAWFESFARRASKLNIRGITVSVMDLYRHRYTRVNNMYARVGVDIEKYYPNQAMHTSLQYREVTLMLFHNTMSAYNLPVSVCCEQGVNLPATPTCEGGCDWWITSPLWELLSMPPGYQRKGCTCPKAVQLLTYANKCHHECVYCYRKD